MKIRKSLSISDSILELAEEIIQARRFDDFSEFVSALIREEHDRRDLTPIELPKPPAPAPTKADIKAYYDQAMAHHKMNEAAALKDAVNSSPQHPAEKEIAGAVRAEVSLRKSGKKSSKSA
jgi:hypothetical protein